MKIWNLTEQDIVQEILQATENLFVDLKWIEKVLFSQHNELGTRAFLVLSRDGVVVPSAAGHMLEVVLVQYFRDCNCGYIRFLGLKNGDQEEPYSCGWRKELMKEAEGVLNQEARTNGFHDIYEIFSDVSTNSKALRGCFPRRLYDVGFRLLETESLLQNVTRENYRYLLIYRPCLIPNYQVEDGTFSDHARTDIVLQVLKVLVLVYNEWSEDGMNEGEGLIQCINALELTALTLISVKSSFPWHGKGGPSPNNQVVVIGGGVAGLAAAVSLTEAGFDVVLLEAANYLGGRVKQVQPFEGFAPIDLGGEFIHGSKTVINKIAEENNWLVQQCFGCEGMEKADKFHHKGELFPLFSDQPDIQGAWKAWDEIIVCSEKLPNGDEVRSNEHFLSAEDEGLEDKRLPKESDKTVVDAQMKEATASLRNCVVTEGTESRTNDPRIAFDVDQDMSILEWLERKQCSDDVIAVFDAMYCQTTGASPRHMGLFESAREEHAWDYGNGNFRLAESYSQLVKHLLDKCREVDKRLCWQVKEVTWKGDGILQTGDEVGKVRSDGGVLVTSQQGETLTAKYVIITVPLTVLKDGDISFVPDLPNNKKRAIDIIQMRGALKIVCRFRERFWPETLNLVYSVRGFVSQIWMYTRDSADSDEKCHVIAGFLTAEPAEEKIGHSGKDMLDGFLRQLDEIFGTEASPQPASDSFMDYVYYHWSKHPFVRGGYSSPTAHAYNLRQDLARPVEDRLFFAGEATSEIACATVHTAMETGLRAAGEVCVLAGKSCNAKL